MILKIKQNSQGDDSFWKPHFWLDSANRPQACLPVSCGPSGSPGIASDDSRALGSSSHWPPLLTQFANQNADGE